MREVLIAASTQPCLFIKSTRLIAANWVQGESRFSARRLFNVLIALAQQDGRSDDGEYSADLSVLATALGLASVNPVHFRGMVASLMEARIDWADGQRSVPVLHQAMISAQDKPRLFWRFDLGIDAEIHSPVEFATLDLNVQQQLTTYGSLTLYEYAAAYGGTQPQLSPRLPWKEWVKLLAGKAGNGPTHDLPYSEYKYFKRSVVKPALEQVQRFSPWRVEMMEFRTGATVADLMLLACRVAG